MTTDTRQALDRVLREHSAGRELFDREYTALLDALVAALPDVTFTWTPAEDGSRRIAELEAAINTVATAAEAYREATAGRGHTDPHDHQLPGHADNEGWPPRDCSACAGAQYGSEADLFENAIPEAEVLAARAATPREAPTDERLREENARLREFLALRPSGFTGPLDDRIPWFIHCGISHGADRPDCIVCRALATEGEPTAAEHVGECARARAEGVGPFPCDCPGFEPARIDLDALHEARALRRWATPEPTAPSGAEFDALMNDFEG